MKTSYELMNLDMGAVPITNEFIVGPYLITLKQNYHVLYSQLSKNAYSVKEYGNIEDEVREVVTKHNSTIGSAIVTAVAECENEPNAFLISESFNRDIESKGIWDLCIILSFLTGKRVFIPENQRRYRHVSHGEAAVQDYEIPMAARIAWENMKYFSTEKERIPLWYFLHMNETPEAQLKLILGCVSLEVIQRIEKPDTTVETSEEMSELITNLRKVIDESNILEDLKDRLRGTVGNWGGSSAPELFKQFLISGKIIDPDISGVPLQRVNGVFQLRNGIAHKGEILKPRWISDPDEKEKVAIFISGKFIPTLVEDYINRRFGIGHLSWPSKNSHLLREFIYEGTWDGDSELVSRSV